MDQDPSAFPGFHAEAPMARLRGRAVPPGSYTGLCPSLDTGEPCVPCVLARAANEDLQALRIGRRRVHRREALYRQGEPLRAVYALRAGTFKSVLGAPDGAEQVTGFQLAGELLGLDGLADGRHATSVFALEDAELLVLPYDPRSAPHDAYARLLARELARERSRTLLLAHRSAEARVTAFLVDLSRRMLERGYSGHEFRLRMSRAEIGSHLGLTFETVSRTFSALQQQGMLEIAGRHVRMTDPEALARVCAPRVCLH